MAETMVVLPGDPIDSNVLPTAQKRKIGLGIKQEVNTNDFTSTIAGKVEVDHKKKSAVVSTPKARYVAKTGDSVIAQVRGGSFETFHLNINAYSPPAILSHFAFEGASKKTRPQLKNGDLVYARVAFAQKNMEIELTCVNPSTGKADGLGQLNDGMVFDVSLQLADRLLKKQLASLMEELGNKIPGGFELVVGKNGKVWVDCADAGIKGIIAVGRVLQEADDGTFQEKEQKKFINRTIKELGLS
ncbi:exosome non-catalytic core subunit rrp40 [Neophaeococcomyces mojaviensis]|uniref:Exosome non-catalytic core subunit rrp40 n=1 Tax=Neophaeococcomyces mojaviensis TaxID=3383035 RepID=A0ACC3A750_9EURO|nr:exosome non-catalytic core subunit rrp40 [Knufia sp. JES_112]